MTNPPVCDYEGSDYQTSFWDQGGREYEDRAEAIALKTAATRAADSLLLELGAGAGRNTPRYTGYERIVLLDYSRTQLQQARARLGDSAPLHLCRRRYLQPALCGWPVRRRHHDPHPAPHGRCPKALAQVGARAAARSDLHPGICQQAESESPSCAMGWENNVEPVHARTG